MKLNLHPGEYVLKVYRKSEITLAGTVVIVLLALYIPWFLVLKYDVATQAKTWLFLWTLAVFIYAVRTFMIWHLNRYVVTSERLVRLMHEGIFKRVVIDTPFERILNISYKTTGLPSVLFKYGDVEVQVVGLMEPIILKSIKQPQQIKDYLWQQHQDHMKRQNQRYDSPKIARLQEQAGYTKPNQKVL